MFFVECKDFPYFWTWFCCAHRLYERWLISISVLFPQFALKKCLLLVSLIRVLKYLQGYSSCHFLTSRDILYLQVILKKVQCLWVESLVSSFSCYFYILMFRFTFVSLLCLAYLILLVLYEIPWLIFCSLPI